MPVCVSLVTYQTTLRRDAGLLPGQVIDVSVLRTQALGSPWYPFLNRAEAINYLMEDKHSPSTDYQKDLHDYSNDVSKPYKTISRSLHNKVPIPRMKTHAHAFTHTCLLHRRYDGSCHCFRYALSARRTATRLLLSLPTSAR
jgi:hypothetical protein